MKKRSPDILWVFAAIFVAGVLFSAVSEGDDRPDGATAVYDARFNR